MHCAEFTLLLDSLHLFVALLIVFAQNKEIISLRGDHEQLAEMKTEVQRLHSLEQTCKLSTDRIAELELIIVQLTTDLEQEKSEKESVVNDRDAIKKESKLVRTVLFLLSAILY